MPSLPDILADVFHCPWHNRRIFLLYRDAGSTLSMRLQSFPIQTWLICFQPSCFRLLRRSVVDVQAPGRSLTGLEALTVRTSSKDSNALDCHLVELDTDSPGTLKSFWTWAHMGLHEVSVLWSRRFTWFT